MCQYFTRQAFHGASFQNYIYILIINRALVTHVFEAWGSSRIAQIHGMHITYMWWWDGNEEDGLIDDDWALLMFLYCKYLPYLSNKGCISNSNHHQIVVVGLWTHNRNHPPSSLHLTLKRLPYLNHPSNCKHVAQCRLERHLYAARQMYPSSNKSFWLNFNYFHSRQPWPCSLVNVSIVTIQISKNLQSIWLSFVRVYYAECNSLTMQ